MNSECTYLSSKAAKVTLTKVSLHQKTSKEIWFVDFEGFSIRQPTNDVVIAFHHCVLEDGSKFGRKSRSWTVSCVRGSSWMLELFSEFVEVITHCIHQSCGGRFTKDHVGCSRRLMTRLVNTFQVVGFSIL